MKKNLCIIYDDYFLKHEAEIYHAERPERLTAILQYLNKNKLNPAVDFIRPDEAEKEHITLAHSETHYNFVKESIEINAGMLDPDTFINKHSWKAALLAAGSVIKAVDLVSKNSYKNVFCLVRPPGHHAEKSRSMGFCIFNNIAVGVKHALSAYGKKRIAVVDWDVHHGNGTQDIFYDSSDVLFISIHQHPLYPGTGMLFETGAELGKGFTLNYPLPPGTEGKTYISLFQEEIIKKLTDYNPEMLFISAGFDAHEDDPLANMNLSSDDYGVLTSILNKFAAQQQIPVISVLEGGYNLHTLSESVYQHLNILNT